MAATAPKKHWSEDLLGVLCCSSDFEIMIAPNALESSSSRGGDEVIGDDSDNDSIDAMPMHDPIAEMEARRSQRIAAMEAAELDAQSAGDDGADAVLLLVTSTPTRVVDGEQETLRKIFSGRRMSVREIDGAHTARREELVALSGRRAMYPQVLKNELDAFTHAFINCVRDHSRYDQTPR